MALRDKTDQYCFVPKIYPGLKTCTAPCPAGQKSISNPCPVGTKSIGQALNPKIFHPYIL